jgi:SAM-dependent methyltransferase
MSAEHKCRSCGDTHGRMILDLGEQPLANNLLSETDREKTEPRFPLRVFVCPRCWLVQITDIVPPVDLFCNYLYFSSYSDTMLRHAREAVAAHTADFNLGAESLVVEIASNDGYLLKNFVAAGIPSLGIEPAANIAAVARENGIETECEFFTRQLGETLRGAGRASDLILGNNVFAHAPDTNDFVAGLAELLKPGGAIVLEFPYAIDLFSGAEFDTIYHEHVFYFSLHALRPLFGRHGLEIFRVERLPIHGGSLRIYAGHQGHREISDSVTVMLQQEAALGVSGLDYYLSFAWRVEAIRRDLLALLKRLRDDGKRVAAYGASAKGSTLMNFCGLTVDEIEFVADRSRHKQGYLTPGTHIPIVGPEELAERRPDYTLLLTWNFAEEILHQQQVYRENGGKFVVPIPEVRLV